MMTVIDANLIPIAIALLIGLVIGWWAFRRAKAPSQRPTRLTESVPRRTFEPGSPKAEAKDTIADEGAAAAVDVASEILGVEEQTGPSDNLQLLKGVGPRLAVGLNQQGLVRFDQLGALGPDDIARIDETLGAFKGRLVRDRIVEQAAFLARGDREGFEAEFGKLGGA